MISVVLVFQYLRCEEWSKSEWEGQKPSVRIEVPASERRFIRSGIAARGLRIPVEY